MYINPLELVVCPLPALARYIITHPSIITGQINLFEGNYQYERFNKVLNEVVRTNLSGFESLGISVEDFGTYFIRKGAATFAATGCTLSPPME